MSKLSNNITIINEIKQLLQTKALPVTDIDIYEGLYDGSGESFSSKLYNNTRIIGRVLEMLKSSGDYESYNGSFEGDGEVILNETKN